MKPAKISSKDETMQLLEAGARSYPEAATALIAYEQEVQKKCRSVLESYIEDYGLALKVQPRLNSGEIASLASQSDKWEGDWRSLGVRIVRNNITSAIRRWNTVCCLTWQSEAPTFSCEVGEWLEPSKIGMDLFQKFQPLNKKVLSYSYYVWIHQSLKVEEGATFEQPLQALLRQWIDMWNKVSGMKAVFKA